MSPLLDDIVGPKPYYFKFDRLGVRVPTIMISPWINKGTGTLIFFYFTFFLWGSLTIIEEYLQEKDHRLSDEESFPFLV
jgi:hypothetical protein